MVQPMNIHDEIMASVHPDAVSKVTEAIGETISHYRESMVRLLGMTWTEGGENWANTKKGFGTTHEFVPK